MKSIVRFYKDESGVTAIEYGLLAGLIALMIIAGATLIGQNLDTLFNYIAGKIWTAPTPPAG